MILSRALALALIFVAAAASTPAPTAAVVPELEIKPTPARGAFFALSVPDAEASAKWYQRALGLKVMSQPPGTDKIKVLILEGEGVIVELIQSADAKQRREHDPQRANFILRDNAGNLIQVFGKERV